MFHSEVCKLRETLKLSAINLNYGCSFVGKLSLKKKIFFFLKKYLCFLQNIRYLQKKMFL